MEEESCSISKAVAVTACTAMALFYVAVLYAPTLILRLPPPTSLQVYMTRRFLCAFISTAVSVLVCVLILPVSFDCFFPVISFWKNDCIVCFCYELLLNHLRFSFFRIDTFNNHLSLFGTILGERKKFEAIPLLGYVLLLFTWGKMINQYIVNTLF